MTYIMDKVYNNLYANKDADSDLRGSASIVLGGHNQNANKGGNEGK